MWKAAAYLRRVVGFRAEGMTLKRQVPIASCLARPPQDHLKTTVKTTLKTTVKTTLGTLTCYVVESEAKSALGFTKLVSYYHKEFGFVKLNYTNIDKSRLILELQSME